MWDSLIAWTIHFFSNFPHWLATILIAMIPIGELRIALPVAVFHYHFPLWQAFILAVIGNVIPALIILWGAGRFHIWLEKHAGFWGKHWVNYLASVQRKFAKYQKYELWGLLIFIGSSLPGTGAYSGALAAFILGIQFKKSWPYVVVGVIISGILTALVTVGADKIF